MTLSFDELVRKLAHCQHGLAYELTPEEEKRQAQDRLRQLEQRWRYLQIHYEARNHGAPPGGWRRYYPPEACNTDRDDAAPAAPYDYE
jgi:hypothetical protein